MAAQAASEVTRFSIPSMTVGVPWEVRPPDTNGTPTVMEGMSQCGHSFARGDERRRFNPCKATANLTLQ
jgi:hypothetical protein